MVDITDPATRSRIMARVKSKDTSPELRLRKMLFAAGYRYRLHVKQLPGKPDLVFAGKRKVIFVHGCFWHLHEGCTNVRLPKSNRSYWLPKLERNRERDRQNLNKLRADDWSVLVIWECELNDPQSALEKAMKFLNNGG